MTPDDAVRRVMHRHTPGRSYTFDEVCEIAYEVANEMHGERDEHSHCVACGAPKSGHRHGMTRGLVAGLVALYAAGPGPHQIASLDMTFSVRCNFQKLQYWKLTAKRPDPTTGSLDSGWWEITDLGRQFVRGNVTVARFVRTFRGNPEGTSGKQVAVYDRLPVTENRDEFRSRMEPLW